MVLVYGNVPREEDGYIKDSMKDVDTLDEVNILNEEINNVENTNSLSIVDFMKMIKPPSQGADPLEEYIKLIPGVGENIDLNQSFFLL